MSLLKKIQETLGVLHYIFVTLYFSQGLGLYIYIYCLYHRVYFIVLPYTLWFLYDFKRPFKADRSYTIFRNMKLWTWLKDYFPASLVKTCDLSKDRNYLMVCHPHGLTPISVVLNFLTDVTHFQEYFPGIKTAACTFPGLFYFPFYREYAILNNLIPAKTSSMIQFFRKRGTGNALALIVGGTDELLEAYPGSTRLVLKKRKGFIKLALRTGTDLVPVFTFGENDTYGQLFYIPGFSWMKPILKRLNAIFGCSFIWPTNIMPKKVPLRSVVGKPIHVEQIEEPTNEQIDLLHQKYMTELEQLFEEYKLQYGLAKGKHLIFL